MNRRRRQDRIKTEGYFLPRRSFNPVWILVVLLVVVAALAVVWSAGAVDIPRLLGADRVLQVPRDYATIQAAIDAANSGEIIQVDTGVYSENLLLNKPVTLIAKSFDAINPANNTAIIDGGGGAVTILIPPGLTQMPTVRGFVIRNGAEGIHASATFIAEYNLFYTGTSLVSYQQGGGGINRGNVYFHATNDAILLNGVDRPLLIENNRILYNGETGIAIDLTNATVSPATAEIDIWNNMILGNHEDGIKLVDHLGNPQDTNRRFVIAGNLIANNTQAGIGLMPDANTLEDYSGVETVAAVHVFNNTFYGNEYGISGGGNLVAFNNIIANSLDHGAWKVQGGPGSNAVVAYSLFFNNPVDAEQSSLGAGVILGVDPLFEAAPNPGPDGVWSTLDDDFSGLVLQSRSPAIDKGITQYQANNGEFIPPSPLSGFTGDAPDLGWREHGAPIFMTPTATSISIFAPLPTATVTTLPPQPTQTPLPLSPSPLPASATPVTVTVLPTTSAPVSPTVASPSPSPAVSTATSNAEVTIQSISPNSVPANTAVTMTITGSGFQPGASVTLEGGQGLPQEILGVQVVDPDTIIVTLNAQNDGLNGPQVWDVRVTNPDGSGAVLEGAFTVTPAP